MRQALNHQISSHGLSSLEASFSRRSIATIPPPSDPAIVQGHIQIYQCAFGASLCAADSTAVREERRVGMLSKGLWVIQTTGGRGRGVFGKTRELDLCEGDTTIIRVEDEEELVKIVEPGKRFACLIAQASADSVVDPQLADAIDKQARATSVQFVQQKTRPRIDPRLLLPQPSCGLVQLTAESCASSLLAFALEQDERADWRADSDRELIIAGAIRAVRDRLHDDPYGSHSLASLAQAEGISISTLKAQFLSAYGIPVISYLRGLRLDLARAALIRGDITVGQAAYRCGYDHPANFATAFRRRFGCTPREIRASVN